MKTGISFFALAAKFLPPSPEGVYEKSPLGERGLRIHYPVLMTDAFHVHRIEIFCDELFA
jgi:hypothetical protein